MWIEERQTQKGTVYRYYERYKCPKTNTMKRVSVTLEGNSPKHQKRAYTKLMCKINEAKEALEVKTITPTVTLYQVIEEWINYYKPTVSPRTQNTYDSSFNRLKALFEDIPLYDLKSIYIEEVLVNFHHVQGATYKYTCSLLRILKNALQYARRKGYIANVQDFLDITIKAKPKTITEIRKASNKFLDHNELKLCFAQLANIHKRIGLLIEFMTFTGLRIGELLALRECDYNRFNGAIDVNGSYDASTRTRGTPKNLYSYRKVPLNDRSKEIIEFFIRSNRWQYMSLGEPPEEERYIFINQNGHPYETQQINKILKR
ncbi:tyrosine-type recombinase/integrase [Veillonella criceti]|nr:site-specific integrase [Veillonella criceti]SUP79494.1 site-specific tyrosine recombinase XerC [Veillonella criceti]